MSELKSPPHYSNDCSPPGWAGLFARWGPKWRCHAPMAGRSSPVNLYWLPIADSQTQSAWREGWFFFFFFLSWRRPRWKYVYWWRSILGKGRLCIFVCICVRVWWRGWNRRWHFPMRTARRALMIECSRVTTCLCNFLRRSQQGTFMDFGRIKMSVRQLWCQVSSLVPPQYLNKLARQLDLSDF